jgi:probable phosphoglycerate mutase
MKSSWPSRLWIVRHGQSAGNVARDRAYAAGRGEIDLAVRDIDVPLSDLGQAQSAALGSWFASLPPEDRPTIILASPYTRAQQTARAVMVSGGLATVDADLCTDERLREREFGILDRLTTKGIEDRYPDQARARRRLGKFYHRPPGGESWCDVILRLRAALDTFALHHRDERVLIVGHQVVVLCLRYLLEGLTEAEILAIDAEGDVANCGITAYSRRLDGSLILEAYNLVVPPLTECAAVTSAPDAKATAP